MHIYFRLLFLTWSYVFDAGGAESEVRWKKTLKEENCIIACKEFPKESWKTGEKS